MTKNATIGIRLPASLREWLEQQAESDSRTLSNYIQRVLEQHRQQVEAGDKEAAAGHDPA